MDKIWAYIPARKKSKSIIHKNVQEINGVSLMNLSIRYAKALGLCEKIFIDTDSDDYREMGEKDGADVSYIRPDSLSGDDIQDLDILVGFLKFAQKKGHELPKFIIHLRPTTPLRELNIKQDLLKALEKDDWSSIRSVHPMGESSYKNAEVDIATGFLKCVFTGESNLDLINSPKQKFPQTYIANGYLDVLRVDLILKEKRVHGEKCFPLVTKPVVEIDSAFELEMVRRIAEVDQKKYAYLFKESDHE